MIGFLRRALRAALGRTPVAQASGARDARDELARRLEAARRRLKETVQPPED